MGNEKSRTCRPNETCVICQEDVENNVSRPDSCPDHFFHHDCLMKWAEHKNTCPLDNKVFNHVVDLRGRKVSVPKRKKEEEDNSQILQRMLLLLSLLNNHSNDCNLCGEGCPELERAKLPCGHRFHRKCIVTMARISATCPVDNCNKNFEDIDCEFGERLLVTELTHPFSCGLCIEVNEDLETAVPDSCSHRFHRRCLERRGAAERTCEQCGADIHFLKCDLGERIVVAAQDQEPCRCAICLRRDWRKEEVCAVECGHLFHRECVLSIFRTAETCPVESCGAPLSNLRCHFGDEFGHAGSRSANHLHTIICEMTCDDDFICAVCDDRKPNLERAKLECDCEFHRECISTAARRLSHPKCPKCGTPFNSARCMFGDTLTFSPRTLEEDEENRTAETTKEEEERTGNCSLCQAPIEPGSGCRSSACVHPYHTVCLQSIKEVEGTCVRCQKNVPSVLMDEEQGAAAAPSTPSPVAMTPTNECSLCHRTVSADDRVHSDVCDHPYHLYCLAGEIAKSSGCRICGRTMGCVMIEQTRPVERAEDEPTVFKCIVCSKGMSATQCHQMNCCGERLHQNCLQTHLAIIRECPVCEIPFPE